MTNNSNSSNNFNQVSIEIQIIWCAVFIVVGFLIVVVNLATILTFVINKHLRRRSVYCLINLAVADMLFGVSNIVLESIYIVEYLGLKDYDVGILFIIVICLAVTTCLFSLVLVSIERVYATFFPFRHRTTRLRMYIAVFAITWLISLLGVLPFCLLPGSVRNVYLINILMVLFLVCLIIICTSYTSIFVKVKNQAKRLLPNQRQTAAIQIRQKREQHLAMTLFVVTVLSLITWLPNTVAYIININTSISYVISSNVLQLVELIQRTNSLINPIIYVFRMRDFRKALSQLIFKCSRDQQHTRPIGHHGNHCREQPPLELGVM
jgi:hypothetical protein